MKIDSNLLFPDNPQVNGVGNQGSSSPQKKPPVSQGSPDSVQLSVDQSTIRALQDKLGNVPDVRSQRVAALQDAIRNGSYQVSNEKIADAMFNELLGRK
jgi:negative regulator of flagellin synthesis FlgM